MPLLLLMQARGSGQGQGQAPSRLQQAGQAEILEFPRRTAGAQEQQQVRTTRQPIFSPRGGCTELQRPTDWNSIAAMDRL